MRVTIINQFYVPDISPTAHLSASLADDRAARGDAVTVITSWGGYVPASTDQSKSSKDDNPRVHRIWTPRLGKATHIKRLIDYASFYIGALWRVVRLPRQDVIISLTTPPYIVLTALAHKMLHRRTKVVLWSMDCYPDAVERMKVIKDRGALSRLMRLTNRIMFKRLDHLVCLDTAMAELLISQYGPARRALDSTVIPNWEKASFFPPDGAPEPFDEIAALKKQGTFVILYLGNTGYGHQFDTVLDAAQALADDPVVFFFIGGGKRWAQLERDAAQRELGNVHLRGYVPKDQTPAVMAAADCALITLADIALGVMSPSKLHSNLAMRLPVIYVGPEKSNVDDAIKRFGCGISLHHGETDALVRFIRDLVGDTEKLQNLRAEARRAFDEAYCDTQTLPQFEDVLKSIRPSS
ncbi:MAG: glycosyltransferase family 4 protein [Phycisphaerales bacterium]|nr:glycosyltransferase family 4 protein [Phycisphaerales bacterium]